MDAATWRPLLGADRFAAGPGVLAVLVEASDDKVGRAGVFFAGGGPVGGAHAGKASKDKGGKQRS